MKRDALILAGNEGIIIASNGTQVIFLTLENPSVGGLKAEFQGSNQFGNAKDGFHPSWKRTKCLRGQD